MKSVAKSFDILAIKVSYINILIAQQNYFSICSYLYKFLDTSVKPFFFYISIKIKIKIIKICNY